MHFGRKLIIVASVGSICVTAIGAFILQNRERYYDPDFDVSVLNPAYGHDGPTVLFDEGHLNTHTAEQGYRPFVALARNDGYQLRILRETLSTKLLDGVSILVIVLARGSNVSNDDAAFSESECLTIHDWVRSGGSLLLITDHWPYGASASSLSKQFEVQMGSGMVEDPKHHAESLGDSHIVFTDDEGTLRSHPITKGRNSSEQVRRVLTFTGQSILGPPGAVPFLALADSALERPPTPPIVHKNRGNTQIEMQYGDPRPVNGRAQGIAFEVEKGRIVILGEAGMLRANRERGGARVGMNMPDYDNRQLAINIMHWLSRIL